MKIDEIITSLSSLINDKMESNVITSINESINQLNELKIENENKEKELKDLKNDYIKIIKNYSIGNDIKQEIEEKPSTLEEIIALKLNKGEW